MGRGRRRSALASSVCAASKNAASDATAARIWNERREAHADRRLVDRSDPQPLWRPSRCTSRMPQSGERRMLYQVQSTLRCAADQLTAAEEWRRAGQFLFEPSPWIWRVNAESIKPMLASQVLKPVNAAFQIRPIRQRNFVERPLTRAGAV